MRAVAVSVGLLLIVGLAHTALRKHVTLVVDGRLHSVSTSSSNVQDLLVGQGITLTSDVLVVPPPGTSLADGMTVVVSPAPGAPGDAAFHPVIPGSTDVGVWVVDGTSEGLVESSGSASSAGTSPVVSVRAVVSGKVHDVLTNAGTAGALLSAMGITPDAFDRVQPSPSTPLHPGIVDHRRPGPDPHQAGGRRDPVPHRHHVLAAHDAGHAVGWSPRGRPVWAARPTDSGWWTARFGNASSSHDGSRHRR